MSVLGSVREILTTADNYYRGKGTSLGTVIGRIILGTATLGFSEVIGCKGKKEAPKPAEPEKPAPTKPTYEIKEGKIHVYGQNLSECTVTIDGKSLKGQQVSPTSITADVPKLKPDKYDVVLSCCSTQPIGTYEVEKPTPPSAVEKPTPPPKVETPPAAVPKPKDICKKLGFKVPEEKVKLANEECGSKTLKTEKNECCQQYELGIK